MTLPNFLIIGQIKGGTSSLYHYCKEHPEIFMPSLKEARFFAIDNQNPNHLKEHGGPYFPIKTIDEYKKLFDGVKHEKAIGEASPNYFRSSIAPARIREVLPNAKLIASLRNPADRIYSAYLMRLRGGNVTRPFITEFRDAHSRATKSGFAFKALKRYYDMFGAGQLKVILFDDLKENATKTMQDIFHFLDVSTDFTPDVSVVYNRGGIPKNKILNITLRFFKGRKVKERLKSWLPSSVVVAGKKLNRRNLQKPPPLEPQVRKEIIEYYREDILRLQDLIGRDLSRWIN